MNNPWIGTFWYAFGLVSSTGIFAVFYRKSSLDFLRNVTNRMVSKTICHGIGHKTGSTLQKAYYRTKENMTINFKKYLKAIISLNHQSVPGISPARSALRPFSFSCENIWDGYHQVSSYSVVLLYIMHIGRLPLVALGMRYFGIVDDIRH